MPSSAAVLSLCLGPHRCMNTSSLASPWLDPGRALVPQLYLGQGWHRTASRLSFQARALSREVARIMSSRELCSPPSFSLPPRQAPL